MATAMPLSTTVDPEAILQAEVNRYVGKGFRVTSQTPRTAQLIKPKKFSVIWAVIWFVLMLLPFVIYLLYYVAKRDQQVYLTVDEQGNLTRK